MVFGQGYAGGPGRGGSRTPSAASSRSASPAVGAVNVVGPVENQGQVIRQPSNANNVGHNALFLGFQRLRNSALELKKKRYKLRIAVLHSSNHLLLRVFTSLKRNVESSKARWSVCIILF